MGHTNRKKLEVSVEVNNTDKVPTSLLPTLKDVVHAVNVKFLFALGFALLASLIYAVEGPRPFERNNTSFGLVLILYLAGFTVAGAIAGTFHRLARRYRVLAYVIGIAAATPMAFATTAALTHNILLWQTGDWIPASIMSVVYGILGVRMFRKDPVRWD